MGWANHAKEELREGRAVKVRPRGQSMKGKVNDGDIVTLEPCDQHMIGVGDIVLVRVRGNDLLHLVKARDGERFLIGNNRGGINGWVGLSAIYGKAVSVEAP